MKSNRFFLLDLKETELGGVYTVKNKSAHFQVRNLKDIIEVIIPHFQKYPLFTQKQADFLLFKEIVELMNKGEHKNSEGLTKIISLRASLNIK